MLSYLHYLIYNYDKHFLPSETTIQHIRDLQNQDPIIRVIIQQLRTDPLDVKYIFKYPGTPLNETYSLHHGMLVSKDTNKVVVANKDVKKVIASCHLFFNSFETFHISGSAIKQQLTRLHIHNLDKIIPEVINTCVCDLEIVKILESLV